MAALDPIIASLSTWPVWAGLLLSAAVILLVATQWRLRGRRRCPSCGVDLVPVGDGAALDGTRLTYDVLACPRCTNALTMVEGARARFAWCPECRERTLETPCIRLPDGAEKQRRVEVHEHCHLCGHAAVREVADAGAAPAKRGQVIPFPKDRRKKTG